MDPSAKKEKGQRKKQPQPKGSKEKFWHFFWLSGPDEHKLAKFFCSLPIGYLIGFCLYWSFLASKEEHIVGDSEWKQNTFKWIIITALAIGFATTPKIRAICCLVIPQVLGKAGHTTLQAWIIFFLLTQGGPIYNMLNNGQAFGDAMLCNLEIAQNVTMTRVKLQANPLKDLAMDLVAGAFEARKTIGLSMDILKPIEKELGIGSLMEGDEDQVRAKEDESVWKEIVKEKQREEKAARKAAKESQKGKPEGMRRRTEQLLVAPEELTENEVLYGDKEPNALRKFARFVEKKAMDKMRANKEEKAEKELLEDVEEREKEMNLTDRLKNLKSKVARKFAEKTLLRCDDIYNTAQGACMTTFNVIYDKCVNFTAKVFSPFIHKIVSKTFCKIFRVTIFCNAVEFLGIRNLKCKLGSMYNETIDFADAFDVAADAYKAVAKEFDLDIQFDLNLPSVPKLKVKNLKKFASIILDAKASLHEFGDIVVLVVSGLMIVIIGLGVYNAYKYVKMYLTDIKFDNCYLTRYWQQIDIRRKKRSAKNPKVMYLDSDNLLKSERALYIEPLSPRLHGQTKSAIIGGLVKVLVMLSILVITWYLDRTVTEILCVLHRYDSIAIRQTGIFSLSFNVTGEGFMSSMLKSILANVSKSSDVDQELDNSHCKLRVHDFNNVYEDPEGSDALCWPEFASGIGSDGMYWWIKQGFLLVFMALLTVAKGYVLRLRWVICWFFYRKRQKTRILWLYNTMMRNRATAIFYLEQKLIKQIEEEIPVEEFSLLKIITEAFPCQVLKKLIGKKCLICGEKLKVPPEEFATEGEPKEGGVKDADGVKSIPQPMKDAGGDNDPKFRKCSSKETPHYYCLRCWTDVQTQKDKDGAADICVGCRAVEKVKEKAQQREELQRELEDDEGEQGQGDAGRSAEISPN